MGRQHGRGPVLLLGLIGLAAMAVGLFYGGIKYTSQPSFCASCHAMETRYVSWLRSSHGSKAGCMDCHSEPGAWNEFKAHMNGLRYLWVQVTGEKTGPVVVAEVSDVSCAKCHPAEDLKNVIRGHQVDHSRHLSRDIGCAQCHERIVHGTFSGKPIRPSMTTCVECHQKTGRLTAGCQTCHTALAKKL